VIFIVRNFCWGRPFLIAPPTAHPTLRHKTPQLRHCFPHIKEFCNVYCWPGADASCRMRKLWDQATSRGHMQNGGQVGIETCSLLTTWPHFSHPDWGFTVIFLSCKVIARVKLKKSGHGPRNPPLPAGTAASPKCPLRIHYAICHPGFNSQAAMQPKFSPLR
jgi:hypothetical protein